MGQSFSSSLISRKKPPGQTMNTSWKTSGCSYFDNQCYEFTDESNFSVQPCSRVLLCRHSANSLRGRIVPTKYGEASCLDSLLLLIVKSVCPVNTEASSLGTLHLLTKPGENNIDSYEILGDPIGVLFNPSVESHLIERDKIWLVVTLWNDVKKELSGLAESKQTQFVSLWFSLEL